MTQLPDTSTEAGQREASVMLARLCRWEYQHGIAFGGWFFEGERMSHSFEHSPNLYDPANMYLMWRIVNWAAENVPHFSKWWHEFAVVNILDLPPAALSIYLCDNILRLADEAGMIEVKE